MDPIKLIVKQTPAQLKDAIQIRDGLHGLTGDDRLSFNDLKETPAAMTIDIVPTEDSTNAVSSGGVFAQIDAINAVVDNQSGTNTGDETAASIITKIGDGLTIDSGYLPSSLTPLTGQTFVPANGVSLSRVAGIEYNPYTQSGALNIVVNTSPTKLAPVILPIINDGSAVTLEFNSVDITTISKDPDSSDAATTGIDQYIIWYGTPTSTNESGIWYSIKNLG